MKNKKSFIKQIALIIMLALLAAQLSGCAATKGGQGHSKKSIVPCQPELSDVSYTVRGQRYTILASGDCYEEQGPGTWYGPKFHGRKTASGERYNQNDLTAAHKTLPFGTLVEVKNPANNKTVVVRINDRGPFTYNAIIDLSRAAAQQIELRSTIPLSIKTVANN